MAHYKRWVKHGEYRRLQKTMAKLIDMQHEPMTTFEMIRRKDEGGMSHRTVDNEEQVVLEGVVFHDGAVSVHWRTTLWSVTFFPDWRTFVSIHIGSHPTNGTILRFYPPNEKMASEWDQDEGEV